MTVEATTPRTLESRKLHLIERLAATESEIIVQQLEVLLLQEEDWWDDLTEAQKKSLQRGLDDAKNGRVYPFEEVMAEIESKP